MWYGLGGFNRTPYMCSHGREGAVKVNATVLGSSTVAVILIDRL